MSDKALIIVDVQNDFCEGGSLAVDGGSAVAAAIGPYIDRSAGEYGIIVTTKDFHRNPGSHFSENPDFQDSWPAHCVADTDGANFHPDLDISKVDAQFTKGENAAAYSGFEGKLVSVRREGEATIGTSLEDYLSARGIRNVDVIGIATDYCVKATALDAQKFGFGTRVLLNFTASVAEDSGNAAVKEMVEAGVIVID